MTNKAEARAVRAAASVDHLAVLVRRHPYISLLAVGAVGVAVGSVVGSRYGQMAAAIGAGFTAHKLLDDASGEGGLRARLLEWLATPHSLSSAP